MCGVTMSTTVEEAASGRPLDPAFISSEVFRRPAFGDNHPLAIPRIGAVMDLCAALGWLEPGGYENSPRADTAALTRFHDPAYVAGLRRADQAGRADAGLRRRHNLGNRENPVFPGVFERAATSCGGSIRAAELALAGRTAFNPAGGNHHALRDRARGFCYVNDPVMAILSLLEGGVGRVFYADLDAHHGDGVEAAFADDARVMTVSIHETDRWPFTGAADDRAGGFARNLPVPKGCNDSELDFLIANAVLPLAEGFRSEAVVVTCGADGLAGDPLSGMALSNGALWRAVGRLAGLTRYTVVVGGGYNPWTVARCWAGLWGSLNRLTPPAILRPTRRKRCCAAWTATWWTTTSATRAGSPPWWTRPIRDRYGPR